MEKSGQSSTATRILHLRKSSPWRFATMAGGTGSRTAQSAQQQKVNASMSDARGVGVNRLSDGELARLSQKTNGSGATRESRSNAESTATKSRFTVSDILKVFASTILAKGSSTIFFLKQTRAGIASAMTRKDSQKKEE